MALWEILKTFKILHNSMWFKPSFKSFCIESALTCFCI
ncbi:Hypothetical protein BN2458_PEG2118 [Helicobacter typhlonius]|uniref:Uncharacterized protein n=1 Tax=Helicobacter typhlonius TaxID=76936 RepID=A0A0S4PXI2_9HELI|nr:Hypothetical protein BN2458_PEG2118 [Helicobacter typhlonius]